MLVLFFSIYVKEGKKKERERREGSGKGEMCSYVQVGKICLLLRKTVDVWEERRE